MRPHTPDYRDPAFIAELMDIRANFVAAQAELAAIRLPYLLRKYNENQPRVPAGETGGGQWTDGGDSGGDTSEAALANPAAADDDDNIITGRIPQRGPKPSPNPGSKPDTRAPPAAPSLPRLPGSDAADRAIELLHEPSMLKDPRKTPVLELAVEYPLANGNIDIEGIAKLDEQQLREACPKYAQVQAMTELAAERAALNRPGLRQPYLGTAIHTDVKSQITSLRDPNFVSERSFLKENFDTYGRPGTIRVDALHNIGNGTVCVFDIKTGLAGFIPGRSFEIARNVGGRYPETQRIIIGIVRPFR